jgi:carbon storage regulator CsrA
MGLVLTRYIGQEVIIDGPATIQVVGIRGRCVKLNIIADRSVKIVRHELLERDRRAEKVDGNR